MKNFNLKKYISEGRIFKESSKSDFSFEIKPKDDARCPDGECQMYSVYLKGEEIYEFSNISFRNMELEKIAIQLLDALSKGNHKISYEGSIKMATEISKYLSN